MIEELKQYGYRFEEGAMVLAQFFADDLGMEAELIKFTNSLTLSLGQRSEAAQDGPFGVGRRAASRWITKVFSVSNHIY